MSPLYNQTFVQRVQYWFGRLFWGLPREAIPKIYLEFGWLFHLMVVRYPDVKVTMVRCGPFLSDEYGDPVPYVKLLQVAFYRDESAAIILMIPLERETGGKRLMTIDFDKPSERQEVIDSLIRRLDPIFNRGQEPKSAKAEG